MTTHFAHQLDRLIQAAQTNMERALRDIDSMRRVGEGELAFREAVAHLNESLETSEALREALIKRLDGFRQPPAIRPPAPRLTKATAVADMLMMTPPVEKVRA